MLCLYMLSFHEHCSTPRRDHQNENWKKSFLFAIALIVLNNRTKFQSQSFVCYRDITNTIFITSRSDHASIASIFKQKIEISYGQPMDSAPHPLISFDHFPTEFEAHIW